MTTKKIFGEWKPGGMGRVPIYGKKMRVTSLYLSDDFYEAAKRLGNGIFAVGVRKALSRHLTPEESPEKIV